ncbi:MAG: GntR family transcriptional regulator [Victivallales bacterium]|jgi:GntR family transcriptional regulator of arabinose operon
MIKTTGYIDIYNTYKERILKGEISSGGRLPSIRDLAKSHSVSMVTVHRAISKLRQDGFVESNGRYGCSAVDDWFKDNKKTLETQAPPTQALNISLVVNWEKGSESYINPCLLSIERMLTSRIYGNGGSINHVVFHSGNEGRLIEDLSNSSRVVFFLIPQLCSKDLICRLEKKGMSCFSLSGSTSLRNDGCDTICVDDAWAFREISTRFMNMGHRKIAFIGLDPVIPGYEWNKGRIEGWREGIVGAGGKASGKNVLLFKDVSETRNAVENLREYTAAVCANDRIALTVMSALKAQGIKVPEDISVTGYDNMPFDSAQGNLTTVAIPEEKITSSFMSLAQRRLSGNAEEMGDRVCIMIRPVIIPRNSWRALK